MSQIARVTAPDAVDGSSTGTVLAVAEGEKPTSNVVELRGVR